METKLHNMLELMNEVTLFLLLNINYMFTNYEISLESKSMMGWVFLGLITINLGLNKKSKVVSKGEKKFDILNNTI